MINIGVKVLARCENLKTACGFRLCQEVCVEVVGAVIFAALPWATHGEVVMVQAPMLDLIVYSTQVLILKCFA